MEIPVTLRDIAGGAANELFDRGLEQIIENIADPNTDANATRVMTLKFIFKPDKDRRGVMVGIVPSTKLAPANGAGTVIYVGQRKADGQVMVVESDPKQLSFNTEPKPTPAPAPVAAAPAPPQPIPSSQALRAVGSPTKE